MTILGFYAIGYSSRKALASVFFPPKVAEGGAYRIISLSNSLTIQHFWRCGMSSRSVDLQKIIDQEAAQGVAYDRINWSKYDHLLRQDIADDLRALIEGSVSAIAWAREHGDD